MTDDFDPLASCNELHAMSSLMECTRTCTEAGNSDAAATLANQTQACLALLTNPPKYHYDDTYGIVDIPLIKKP